MYQSSQTTGYALEALSCLARDPSRPMLARQIAEETGLPLPYLSKILHRLGAVGIIITKRGYKGGVQLRNPPDMIPLIEICDAIEGGCLSPQGKARVFQAQQNSFWSNFHSDCRARLAALTLADILQQPSLL